ncbi:hypothetical protein [Actinomadura viridis]|uniref:Uncharacterized protein n=1 Tax=Actinomadura viridis TaxID=58110 RepID=A0A931DRN7_9ACTN|nr:hypothetical protein [Actinomadura viridis]MBG6093523.1 hypothetical protein [Actinomadura viridis]
MALLLLRLAWLVRSAAWLDRTTLVVRGTVRTHRCELALAERFQIEYVAETTAVPMPFVTLIVPTGRRIPMLTIKRPEGGRKMRLSLIDPSTKDLLPAEKLAALADAITYGRQHGTDSAQAWQTANRLRGMAGHAV